MKRSLYSIFAVAILASTMLISCGKGSKNPTTPDGNHEVSSVKAGEQYERLDKALNSGNIGQIEALADSLAFENERLTSGDRTVDESAILLVAYLKVHEDAVTNNQNDRDLSTLRKFIDVYYEGMDNSMLLSQAFASDPRVKGRYNLDKLVKEFSGRLDDIASGDPGATADSEALKEKVDTTKTASAEEIPEPEQPVSETEEE